MTTVNPEQVTEEKSEVKNILSNDKLREAYNDPSLFDSFSQEEKEEFHRRFVEGDEKGIPEDGEIKPNQDAIKEPAIIESVEQEPKIEKKPEDSEDIQALKRKLKEQKDLTNTLQQKLESLAKRKENIDSLKIPEPPKVENIFDEGALKNYQYQKEVAEKQNKLLDEQSKLLEQEIGDIEAKRHEIATSQIFSEISSVQLEYPELRTSKSVAVIDKAYLNFMNSLAGPHATQEEKSAVVDKYLRDPEFRKRKESEGFLFPIDEKDWKNYTLIHQVRSFKEKNKYPDLDTAYYKFKKETGFVPDQIKQTALETAQKVASQLSGSNDVTLMSPGVGKTGSDSNGMTEAQIQSWLIEHPTPSTKDELRVFALIRKQLGMTDD